MADKRALPGEVPPREAQASPSPSRKARDGDAAQNSAPLRKKSGEELNTTRKRSEDPKDPPPSNEKPRPPQKIAGGKYEIEKRLGAGCFGEVWRGIDTNTKEQVAVKFENFQSHSLQLEHECEVLKAIAKPSQPQGFTECFYWGSEGRYHCMVIELLGKSLEDRLQGCGGKFTVASTVLIAEQTLSRIEYLHSRGIIHRDIKPENFMFGAKDKAHILYAIDFGLSKKYYDQKHVNIRTKLSLTGTARYASINAHKGVEQSRRDDLEAIGHMLIYFLRGSLPWSGLEAKTQEEKYRKIREKKEEFPLTDLCKGFPEAFQTYLKTTRNLEFKERPDYKALRKLFSDVRTSIGPLDDHQFQWSDSKDQKDKANKIPVEFPSNLTQPDDQVPKTGISKFCGCFGGGPVKD